LKAERANRANAKAKSRATKLKTMKDELAKEQRQPGAVTDEEIRAAVDYWKRLSPSGRVRKTAEQKRARESATQKARREGKRIAQEHVDASSS
jgi:hypothetical protein